MKSSAENIQTIKDEMKLRDELAGNGSCETYKYNYLVEAGAGAGKTHTMTERIVNQIVREDISVPPSQLAAITFTKKATKELQARIDSKLKQQLNDVKKKYGSNNSKMLRLTKILEEVDQMQVSTIHSFCSNILKECIFDSPLNVGFEVLETKEYKVLTNSYFDNIIKENFVDFEKVSQETGLSLEEMKKTFVSISVKHIPFLYDEPSEELWNKIFTKIKKECTNLYFILDAHTSFDAIVELISNANTKKACLNRRDQIEKVLEMLKLIDENQFCDVIINNYLKEGRKGPFFDNSVMKYLVVQGADFKEKEAIYNEKIDQIKKLYKWWVHSVILALLCPYIEKFRKYRFENNKICQDDLLVCTRDMLKNKRSAREYLNSKYKTIYVDEMQDTDPLQAEILFFLTSTKDSFNKECWQECKPNAGSLFIVGDPKQSIYRFRNADISVYNDLIKNFSNNSDTSRTCTLKINFRSLPSIVNAVDNLFEENMKGSNYQAEYSSMIPYRKPSQLGRVVLADIGKEVDPFEKIARFIHASINCGVEVSDEDSSGNRIARAVRYSDFMIITQKNETVAICSEELSKYNIPVNSAGKFYFRDNEAILRGLFFLQYICGLGDDIKNATILHNCYGVPYSNLKDIKLEDIDEFNYYKKMAINTDPMSVIEEIYLNSEAVWKMSQSPENDYAAVAHFLENLKNEPESDLVGMVHACEKMLDLEYSSGLTLSAKNNCVEVTTMHKSKGLQAEIVILAPDSNFKTEPKSATVTKNGEKVIDMPIFKGKSNIGASEFWGTGTNKDNKIIEKNFLEGEVVRYFYVATTRAKGSLIIITNGNTGHSCWDELANYKWFSKASNEFIDENNPIFIDSSNTYHDDDISWQKSLNALLNNDSDFWNGIFDNEKIVDDSQVGREECEKLDIEENLCPTYQEIKPSDHEFDNLEERKQGEYRPGIRGAEFGTIVHRVLELAINNRTFDFTSRKKYATRAILELDLKPDNNLVDETLVVTSFLEDKNCNLREWILDNQTHSELNFFTKKEINKTDDNVAENCQNFIAGYIDLAIEKDDCMLIVDYKTDQFFVDESDTDYEHRLLKQYRKQLLTYKDIMLQNNAKHEVKAYICAIRLGGKMIEVC